MDLIALPVLFLLHRIIIVGHRRIISVDRVIICIDRVGMIFSRFVQRLLGVSLICISCGYRADYAVIIFLCRIQSLLHILSVFCGTFQRFPGVFHSLLRYRHPAGSIGIQAGLIALLSLISVYSRLQFSLPLLQWRHLILGLQQSVL